MPGPDATGEIAIDLGDARGEPDAGPRPPWHGRLLSGLVVAFASLLGLVAAAPSGSMALGDPLWTHFRPDDVIIGSNVVVLSRPDTVSAHDPMTGAELWRLDVPAGVRIVPAGPGVMLALTSSPDGFTWTAIAERTGAVLFQLTGVQQLLSSVGIATSGESLVFYEYAAGTDCGGQSCVAVLGFDLADGTVVWRYPYDEEDMLILATVDGLVTDLAHVAGGGAVTIIDPTTGSRQGASISTEQEPVGGVLVDGQLGRFDLGGGTVVLSGHAAGQVVPAWTRPTPDGQTLALLGCGGQVCAYGDHRVTALDPFTGAQTVPPAANGTRLGPSVVLATTGNRVLSESATVTMTDAFSGRTLSELTGAVLVDWPDETDRALILRMGTVTSEILLIDSAGGVTSLGRLPTWFVSCRAGGDILACVDLPGGWSFWLLPQPR